LLDIEPPKKRAREKKKRWQSEERKKNVRNPAAYMNEEHMRDMPSIGFTRSRATKKEGKKKKKKKKSHRDQKPAFTTRTKESNTPLQSWLKSSRKPEIEK
jgi:hypothetical protein